MSFTRTIEDFVCAHCGAVVTGSGYTNHCPRCLWSKHLDNEPGDRANECGGLMKPIGIELDHGVTMIMHQCQVCGMRKRNKASDQDDKDAVIALSSKHNSSLQ